MNKRKLLYFKNIKLDPSNYVILKNIFKIIQVENIKQASKLSFKEKKDISVVYCDPNYFYSSSFLEEFLNLKFLVSSTTSIGFIDKKYCVKKKIKIISLENDQKFLKSITPTAEHVFGLILLITRDYFKAINSVNLGKFNRRPFGGFGMLSKLKLGIIGYGRLGKIVKKIANGFGMKSYVCDTRLSNYKKSLKRIFKKSDIVTLHIPSEKNYKFFSQKKISFIKKPFFLINTSRGEIVDEKFVIKLLKSKKIIGYATDVLKNEFSPYFNLKNNIIYKNRNKLNILITPHIGGSTKDAWKLTEYRVIKKLKKRLQ